MISSIGVDSEDADGGIFHGDIHSGDRHAVFEAVKADTQEFQPLQTQRPHKRAVEADAASKDNGVQSAHDGGVCADVFFDRIAVCADGQLRVLISCLSRCLHVAQIAPNAAGHAVKAAFCLEHLLDLFQRHAAGFDQIEDDIGVNIAAAIVVHRAALQRQAERSIELISRF